MGNYVALTSSPSELLSAAQSIRDKGPELTTAMNGVIDTINVLDNDATFVQDQFTQTFVHGEDGKSGYWAMVDSGTGPDGKPLMLRANDAVKANARGLGAGLEALGKWAVDAVWAYTATDDDNANDIGSAGAA